MSLTEAKGQARNDSAPEVVPRQWIGLGAGVVLALITRFTLPDSLSADGKSVASVAVLMAVWWMTEAIPLAATALVPLVLMPLLGVAPIGDVAAPYASATIFLFMGGFIIALAMTRWNLHTRFALSTVLLVGTSPARMIGGFMLATGLLSMWISNTATAVMMLPIGMAVLGLVAQLRDGQQDPNFSTALMLGIAYAASIGSLGTVIGTPPNAFLQSHLKAEYDIDISFFQWMLFGVPIAAVFLVITWLVLTRLVFKPAITEIAGAREMIQERKRALGRMDQPQWTVLAVFTGAAVSWVLVGVLKPHVAWVEEHTSDAGVAMLAVLLLFTLPAERGARKRVLVWEDTRDLPWGILLLFGGGLSLSGQFSADASGLGPWIGDQVGGLDELPVLLMVLVITAVILLLTELTSNTATTATFVPIMAAVAVGLDQDVMLFALPVALAATCAFMLPVATPPNAVVFSSGQVTVGQMIRGGVLLNVIAIVLVTLAVYTTGAWVFDISL
ncbi:SLC13 family permease [Streptomyces sp. N2-109]|uniref:Sodium-dependent dicarboxylate transporter SdcS n=1 Tax=Streptomyces gossypii TaxID=2883101 RepID=A0ABT2JVN9_9ACTN|nr:SLC13 family permease [Streptomyces gossypii]MCT2591738.1 SLC13 family permease [Streptomyces gossypii]